MSAAYQTANSVAVHLVQYTSETLSQLYPSEYFDPSEHMQEQTQARARPDDVDPQGTTVRIAQDGQQVSLGNIQQFGASISSANTFARSAPSTLRALTSMIDCD